MRKTIMSKDGQSVYDILLSIFDYIIVNKVIYLPIQVESYFTFFKQLKRVKIFRKYYQV